MRYVDPDGREDIQPTALMGQKAHRLFFETLDIIKTKEDPSSLKIFDSRLSSIKAWLGIALNPRQNPALDEIPSPNTRPDAVNIIIDSNKNLVEIFELKPISCITGYKHEKSKSQLDGYINKISSFFPDVKIEGGNINSICNIQIPFPAAGEKATITFFSDAAVKGLYYYVRDDGNQK